MIFCTSITRELEQIYGLSAASLAPVWSLECLHDIGPREGCGNWYLLKYLGTFLGMLPWPRKAFNHDQDRTERRHCTVLHGIGFHVTIKSISVRSYM